MSEHTDTNPKLVLDTDNIVGLDHTYWPKHIRIEQSRYLEGIYGRGVFPLINNDDNDNDSDNDTDWMYTYIKDEYLPCIVALQNAGVAQIDGQIMYGPFNCAAWLVKFDVTKIGEMRY